MKKTCLLIALSLFPALSYGEPISYPASLNKVVPNDAMAYVRLPNIWGLLSAPKGNAINDALANPAHEAAVNQLKAALDKTLLQPIEQYSGPELRFILTHLAAPIEAMAVMPQGAPLPNAVIRTRLAIHDNSTFQTVMGHLLSNIPDLQVIQAIDANGEGSYQVGPAALFIKFDASTGNLNLLAGIGANKTALEQVLSLAPTTNAGFEAAQADIDSSGQGLFAWVNTQKILPMLQAQMPPEKLAQLKQMGVLDVQSFAAGIGVAHGKSRLKAIVNIPQTGLRQFIPPTQNNFSVTSAGQPGTLLSLSLLSEDLLKGIEGLLQAMSPANYEGYANAQHKMKQAMGFDGRDLLAAIGPETLMFSDEVGYYLAIRLKDAAKFHAITEKLTQNFGLEYQSATIDGVQHHHVIIPGVNLTELSNPDVAGQPEGIFLDMLSRSRTHLFWVEDNGYLLIGGLPQMLTDHQHYKNRRSLNDWLKNTQKQDPEHALVLFSTTTEKMPRQIYYAYLQMLTAFGDLANAPIDLYALPSAGTLGLAEDGTYGLQFDMGADQLSLSITYESNLFEFLLDPGLGTTVAVVGIMAAVALPAYSDYTTRAKVAEGLSYGSSYKIAATEYYYSNNKLPTNIDQLGLETFISYGVVKDIRVEADSSIRIRYAIPEIYDESVLLTPEVRNNVIQWRCHSDTMSRQFLPSECRD